MLLKTLAIYYLYLLLLYLLNNKIECSVQHEENGGGVETQISMANVHKDHNAFAFTSFTDPMMIVLVFRLYICVELASIFHCFNFVFVFIGS